MCKRFCRLFFRDDMNECCCLALAPSVILFCALQIVVATLYLSYTIEGVAWWLILFLSIISTIDAITGICAVCTSNFRLAFGALLGFFVEFFIHSIVVILRWVSAVMAIMQGVTVGHAWPSGHIPTKEALEYCLEVFELLLHSAVILTTSYFILRVNYSFYRVVQLGGDGWERKSPKDLNEEQFGSSSQGVLEQLDSCEAQRLLDPEADYLKF